MISAKIASNKTILGLGITFLCLATIIPGQLAKFRSLFALNNDSKSFLQEEKQAKVSLSFLENLPSVGFNNLVADWAFLQFVQYFGDDPARDQTGYSLNPNYFEIVVDRDPRFAQALFYFSSATSIYAGRPDRTVSLLAKSLESMTAKTPAYSYYVWLYKGIDELLFLGKTQAAKHSFDMAAEWASTIQDEESKQVAASARQTSEYLAQNPESKGAQVSAWLMVLSSTSDKRTQWLALNRIRNLGAEVIMTPQGRIQVKLSSGN